MANAAPRRIKQPREAERGADGLGTADCGRGGRAQAARAGDGQSQDEQAQAGQAMAAWVGVGQGSGRRKQDGRRGETRQRILTAAGNLFREHGVDGIGVDAVMKEAGLTHGGFYLHFASKEALAAEVSQSLLERAAGKWDEISRLPDRNAALERIVRYYLDADRVASAHCCPLTTLGPDVARRSRSRSAIGGALRGMLDALGRVLPGARRQTALASLATMVGAVVLSRLADDPELAKAFLDAAADSILPPAQGALAEQALAGREDA